MILQGGGRVFFVLSWGRVAPHTPRARNAVQRFFGAGGWGLIAS